MTSCNLTHSDFAILLGSENCEQVFGPACHVASYSVPCFLAPTSPMSRLFQPDLFLGSVTELTPDLLREKELKSLLLDVDCTLKRYRSETIEPDVAAWMETMRQNDVELCLISNGRTPRIRSFAESLRLPFIAEAMKPFPSGCKRALRLQNYDPKTTAMVGDQVFADLLAGKFAGLFTVLVKPIHPEEEQWFTRIKRPFEKILLIMPPDAGSISR